MPPFVPRVRKHKVRRRLQSDSTNSEKHEDSNPLELESSSKIKEESRQALKNELQPVMSSKKKKRLDKYIVSTYPKLSIIVELWLTSFCRRKN